MEEKENVPKIADELYEDFSDILAINESLLNIPEVNGNTLEMRYRMTLEEEKKHLSEFLDQLDKRSLDHQSFTEKLFVIYHADETENLHLGGWKRQTEWIEEEGGSAIKDITQKAGQKKQKLKETATHLEEVFGDELKYVIPAFYRD